MRLQADPTVGYAVGTGPRSRLSLRQLKVASPFNTYLYEGLPPGPICNPGRASIAAVIDPLPTSFKDLFFVADGHGHHIFSATYQEHLANIRKVRSPEPEPPTDTMVARLDSALARSPKPEGRDPGAPPPADPKPAPQVAPKDGTKPVKPAVTGGSKTTRTAAPAESSRKARVADGTKRPAR